jgi:hypothetical protein
VSVIMMLRMQTDPALIERVASEQGDAIRAVSQRGQAAGAIHHAFYAGDDGAAYVIDEWDSPESFRSFFESEQPNIGPLMQAAGVEGEPEIRFFEKLSTGDDF